MSVAGFGNKKMRKNYGFQTLHKYFLHTEWNGFCPQEITCVYRIQVMLELNQNSDSLELNYLLIELILKPGSRISQGIFNSLPSHSSKWKEFKTLGKSSYKLIFM